MGEITTRYAKKAVTAVAGVVGKDGAPGEKGEAGEPGAPGEPGASGASVGVFVDLGGGISFAIDWSAGDWFRIAPTGNFSISFSNTPAAGVSKCIVIELVAGGGKTLTLPAGGTWGSLGQPEFSTAGTDLLAAGVRNASGTSHWFLLHAGT